MDDFRQGKDVEYFDYKRKYEGIFINGKKNGRGKEYIKNDNDKYTVIFDGEYLNDYKLHGKEYYKNGKLKFE